MTVQRWMLAALVAVIAALLALAWTAHAALGKKNQGQMLWREKIQETRLLTKDGKVIPSVHLLKDFEKQHLHFAQKLDELLQSLQRHAPLPEYGNALEFKGDLFKSRRALLARAQAAGTVLPADIGFKEFIGKEIPPSAELENLSLQLAKLREFFDLAMDSGVSEVKEIERGAVTQQRVESDEETPFYRDFSFKTQFFCSPKAFLAFMEKLQRDHPLLVLDNADIRLRSEQGLEIQATFKAVEFARRKNPVEQGAAA